MPEGSLAKPGMIKLVLIVGDSSLTLGMTRFFIGNGEKFRRFANENLLNFPPAALNHDCHSERSEESPSLPYEFSRKNFPIFQSASL